MAKELFLLGAGASMESGIPGAYEMTKKMLDSFSNDIFSMDILEILEFVVGGLLFQQGAMGENPYDGVNIEDLFNAIIMLGERKNSELSPFIGSWHPLLNELEAGGISDSTIDNLLSSILEPVEGMLRQTADEYQHNYSIRKFINKTSARTKVKVNLANAINQVIQGGGGKLFIRTSALMLEKLACMVWITEPSVIDYLIPLVKYANETGSVIATLNYDNTIELAGKTCEILIDTGFNSWSELGKFIFTDGQVPLIKLHGSIDWRLGEGKISDDKPLKYQTIHHVIPDTSGQEEFTPAILFGSKNKLTTKGPFLSLLREFEEKLSDCETLTIIGYSFRDDHINEYIRNWFNGYSQRIIRVINPKFSDAKSPFIVELNKLQDKSRLVIIPKNASAGINDIVRPLSQSKKN